MKADPNPKMRVLVLEDSDLVRSAMGQLLTDKGFDVVAYPDAMHCPLHQADRCPCAAAEVCADVLVTDLDMPQLTGLDFITELIRKGRRIPHLALLSGSHEQETLAQAARLRCKIFTKPGGTLALLDWLDELVAGLQPERQLASCLP
jgi:CheY-like chemotaxis protein